MNKTLDTEYRRIYLLDELPEPLTRASSHIQIFDNYIENTRMRLRSVRDPETRDWMRLLQQRFPVAEHGVTVRKAAEMHLNEAEYATFERFEGREIRKNRYFHEFDGRAFAFDVFIGPLLGLNMSLIEFDGVAAMKAFEPPPFLMLEVTGDPFFYGPNLVGKDFADVRAEIARISADVPPQRAAAE